MKENLNQVLQNYKSAIPQVNGVKPWQDDSEINAAFLINTLNNLYSRSQFFSFVLEKTEPSTKQTNIRSLEEQTYLRNLEADFPN